MASPAPTPTHRTESCESRAPHASDSILYYGLCCLLLFGPLAFGGDAPWAVFVLEIGASSLFLYWLLRQLRTREISILRNPVFLPMLAFAGLVLLQLLSHRSAYAQQSISSLLFYGAYGLICFIAVQSIRRTRQIKKLAVILTIYGSVIALFAIVQSITFNDRIYWVKTLSHGGSIYGPYANHNLYAGLMEMLTPVALTVALSHYVRGLQKLYSILAASLMAATIFLSQSRGGMVALSVQIAALAVILLRRKQPRDRKTLIPAAAFLLLFAILLAYLGGNALLNRMATLPGSNARDLSTDTRTNIVRDSLHMIRQRPILGWGLGTFADVYPRFRTFFTNFEVNQAHNDYVQLLVEMGLLGFATMLWLLIVVFRAGLHKLKQWPADINGAVALASLLGILGILVHSLFDFNLQIRSNALLFYFLCTLAAMEPRFGASRRSLTKPRP